MASLKQDIASFQANLSAGDGVVATGGWTLEQLFNSVPAASGVPVNYSSVWNSAPFFRGCDLISSKIGQIKCEVMQQRAGHWTPYTTHPAYRTLRYYAADWLPSPQLIAQLVKDSLWAGNGYALIFRNPLRLQPLDPRQVVPYIVRDTRTFEIQDIYYRVTSNGTQRDVPYVDMIHCKGCGDSGALWGMPLLDYARDAIGLGLATIRYGSAYFRNNQYQNIIVEVPGRINDQKQADEFRKSIQKPGSPDEAWNVNILQNGAKASFPPRTSNEDAQFLGSLEQSAIVAAQLLGLPASKLGARSVNSSYGSLEQEELSIYKDCYNRWMIALETEFSLKLLSEQEKESGTVATQFDREQLLQGDPEQVRKGILAQYQGGIITLNEANQMLNRDRVDTENADKHFMPSNMVFLEDVQDPEDIAEQEQDPADQPQEDAETPQEDAKDTKGEDLTRAAVTRLLTRLSKAKGGYSSHRSVMVDALKPFGERGEQWVDGLLQELDAVLPEQADEVLKRCDINTVVNNLWK